jgi:hypothetical protein
MLDTSVKEVLDTSVKEVLDTSVKVKMCIPGCMSTGFDK